MNLMFYDTADLFPGTRWHLLSKAAIKPDILLLARVWNTYLAAQNQEWEESLQCHMGGGGGGEMLSSQASITVWLYC